MGKIFYVMGKSACGKDTVYKELLKQKDIPLRTVVLYTTRPIRDGETEGVEYHFTDKETLCRMLKENKVIEVRTYQTVYGDWSYFTAADEQIDIDHPENLYLMIGTLESYEMMRNYYGKDVLIPIYIEVDDAQRLKRAIAREEFQSEPKFKEMCRRYLADEEDFSEEKLKRCQIIKRYRNNQLEKCVDEIKKDIRQYYCSMI